MIYSETLLDHFEQPRQAGQLEPGSPDVGTGVAGTRETGGVLRFQLQVREGQTISDTRFQALGPPALVAAGSWLAEHLLGRPLEAAEDMTHQPVAEALSLPSSSLHCALLAEDALRAAVHDYRHKQKVYA